MVELVQAASPIMAGDAVPVARTGGPPDAMVDITKAKINRQTGTTYTLALTDVAGLLIMSHATSSGVTLPAVATVDIPADSIVVIARAQGAGPVTVAPESGETLNGVTDAAVVIDEAASALFIKGAGDAWECLGAGVAA